MRDQEYSTEQPRQSETRDFREQARNQDFEQNAGAAEEQLRRNAPPKSLGVLEMLAEVSTRLKAVEADNADMRAQIDSAKKSGDLDLDTAHMVHVLNKHFYHDKPEAEIVAPPSPKFDAFTGQALN